MSNQDGVQMDLMGHQSLTHARWRYSLISKYVGKRILEVGSADRDFTWVLSQEKQEIQTLISLEPSRLLLDRFEGKYSFPDHISFHCLDFFDVTPDLFGLFDTVVLSHVLEHIEDDRSMTDKAWQLLSPGGYLLIIAPALPWLFSIHDKALGHYRRYNKKSLRASIDTDKYRICDIWYQDPIGVLGAGYFLKLKKIPLVAQNGQKNLDGVKGFYLNWIIPFQSKIEKFVRFPFGLSITGVFQKK